MSCICLSNCAYEFDLKICNSNKHDCICYEMTFDQQKKLEFYEYQYFEYQFMYMGDDNFEKFISSCNPNLIYCKADEHSIPWEKQEDKLYLSSCYICICKNNFNRCASGKHECICNNDFKKCKAHTHDCICKITFTKCKAQTHECMCNIKRYICECKAIIHNCICLDKPYLCKTINHTCICKYNKNLCQSRQHKRQYIHNVRVSTPLTVHAICKNSNDIKQK